MLGDAKELIALSGSWFLWTGRGNEAKEGKGCSGHDLLKADSGSEGWVSWEWWPQKCT